MALSFAGGDGGNLDSEIWFCGMEWGNASDTHIQETLAKEFQPLSQPTSWQDEDFAGAWKGKYNQKVYGFIKYFYDLDWDGMSYEAFVRKYSILYPAPIGLGFKTNLLPIRFKNRATLEWEDSIKTASGFETFEEYREWCIIHRGKFFRDLMVKHRPKVLVCTGVRERRSFMRAFTESYPAETLQMPEFSIDISRHADTLICGVPFFGGPHGINSHKKMEALVAGIKEKLAP